MKCFGAVALIVGALVLVAGLAGAEPRPGPRYLLATGWTWGDESASWFSADLGDEVHQGVMAGVDWPVAKTLDVSGFLDYTFRDRGGQGLAGLGLKLKPKRDDWFSLWIGCDFAVLMSEPTRVYALGPGLGGGFLVGDAERVQYFVEARRFAMIGGDGVVQQVLARAGVAF